MIISRTPYRISFFGGGTDYPTWFQEHEGAVLATSFDKYCYLIARQLPPFFANKYRLVYSRIELVNQIDEIQHPAIKSVLHFLDRQEGLEIHHYGDLPARSGLGSSSAFTVGLLSVLRALDGQLSTKEQLARDAIYIEQTLIGESVGCQDQILTAFGGFNHVRFRRDGQFEVLPVIMDQARREWLEKHLMLFFSGISRFSDDIARNTVQNLKSRTREMQLMQQMVDQALAILQNPQTPISDFGQLLHEAWQYKRSLSAQISTPVIDEAYQAARQAGAIGGKLLGAGGGGFMLLFVEPPNQERVRQQLKDLIYVPVRFESMGSQIALYQPQGFA